MPYALRRRLRQSLIARYAQLRQRLERMTGSREDAADALQETWVQLEGMGKGTAIQNDDAYLLRMAANIAIKSYKRRNALLTPMDMEDLEHFADAAQDPARHAIARLEAEELLGLLSHMPVRQREILMASRLDGLSYSRIGKEYGISATTVGKEMRRAQLYLEEQINARAERVAALPADTTLDT